MFEIQMESGHIFYYGHLISFIALAAAMWYASYIRLTHRDKYLHILVSSTLTIIFFTLLWALKIINMWYIAPVCTLIIGIAKEIKDKLDKKKQLFDWKDIRADLIGVAWVTIGYIFSVLPHIGN